MLVYVVKHPNFDLMHNISCFSRIGFDEFISKGGEIVYLKGGLALRVLGEFILRGVLVLSLSFEFFLAFPWFAAFRAICWFCDFIFFNMTFLSFSWVFVFYLCLMCLGFKIQTLYFCVINVLNKGEIEKPSGQYLGLIVMSN
jgi:hypothetical protein